MILWQVVDHPASTVRQVCQHFGAPVLFVELQELSCRRLARFIAAYSDELRRRIACEARVMAYSNQSVASNTSIVRDANCSI
jgi:hypothetical protein